MKSKTSTQLPRDDRLTSVCHGNISLLDPVVTSRGGDGKFPMAPPAPISQS